MNRFSPSCREIITNLPSILRGNSAMPLFCAAVPLRVRMRKLTKSRVSSSMGRMLKPL